MRVAFVLALLAGTILAACGGGSSPGAKTSAPAAASGLTKAQYIAQADPICAAGKRHAPTVARIQSLALQTPTPTQEIVRLLHKTTTVLKEVVAQLSALSPPPADRAAIAQWIMQNAAIGPLITLVSDDVQRGDLPAAIKAYGDITAASINPLSFAKDYGLRACSSIGA